MVAKVDKKNEVIKVILKTQYETYIFLNIDSNASVMDLKVLLKQERKENEEKFTKGQQQ